MIFKTGDIFESQCDLITVTVNCVGVMGKGLALQCKERYPLTYKRYRGHCQQGIYRPGEPRLVRIPEERPIVLFPTKDCWTNPSRLEWIDEGLKRIAKALPLMEYNSIALPPLGAGLGGLWWYDVLALMIKHLASLPHEVHIYVPGGGK